MRRFGGYTTEHIATLIWYSAGPELEKLDQLEIKHAKQIIKGTYSKSKALPAFVTIVKKFVINLRKERRDIGDIPAKMDEATLDEIARHVRARSFKNSRATS